MINDSIDALMESIEESKSYRDYLNISNSLKENQEVNNLLEEIRTLQKKSVNLEYNHDLSYKDVDKEIENKVKYLESIPVYKEYLRRMNEFNDNLSMVSKTIENYINKEVLEEE